jgi:hypothetical protein
MGDITFGPSQITKPAPRKFRNFSDATILFLVPGALLLVNGWGLPDKQALHLTLVFSFIPTLLKAIGTFLGNGQYYTSIKAAADVTPVDPKP